MSTYETNCHCLSDEEYFDAFDAEFKRLRDKDYVDINRYVKAQNPALLKKAEDGEEWAAARIRSLTYKEIKSRAYAHADALDRQNEDVASDWEYRAP